MPNLIDHTLGRYHILEQLGEGGMAVVYKARDTRLDVNVAVKVIRTENIQPSALERTLKRFDREAKALARLTHPNIVKVTDYGEYENMPYLVMPLLSGGTLKSKLNGKPMPWQDAIQILIPIADALGYAHKHNIIHRDVKPANILITENGQPMLADFGVAKILEVEETMELTGTGAGIGTPEYMAPEQVTGKRVDARIDIYALGVVFYEMIVGRKPYVADTPMAVLFKHASEPLPRPRQFIPNLPQAVENVIVKSLTKKPEDRYQNMGDLSKALAALASGAKQPSLPVAPKTVAFEKKWTAWAVRLGLLGFFTLALILVGRQLPTIMDSLLAPSASFTPIASPTHTFNLTSTPTETPILTPTPIPLTWKRVSMGQELKRDTITAIAVDPRDQGVIYAGTEHAGVYKTIDGARSWFPSHDGLERAQVRELFIDPQSSNILVVHTFPDEVYRSMDGGKTWSLVLGYVKNNDVQHEYMDLFSRKLIVDPQNSKHFILSDLTGWHESNDSGEAWAYREKGWDCPSRLGAIGFNPMTPTTLLFSQLGDDGDCKNGIYRWDRAGSAAPMLALEIPLTKQVYNGAIYVGFPMLPITDFQSVITTQGLAYVFARTSQGNMFSSTDGGLTWREPILGDIRQNSPRCQVLTIRPDGVGICSVAKGINNSGIKVSSGVEDWRGISASPPSDSITAFSFFADQPEAILVGSHGFFKTLDNGATWTEMSAGLPGIQADLHYSLPNNSLYMVERTACPAYLENDSDSRLFYSGDDGGTWKLMTDLGCGFAIGVDAAMIYRQRNQFIVVSRDGGVSWGTGNRAVGNGVITAIAAHPVQLDTVMAKTALISDFEATASESTFYRSMSRDFVWEELGSVSGKHDWGDSLYYAPSQPEILYTVGSKSNVSRTDDGGETWVNCSPVDSISPNLASILAIHPNDSDKVYLATLGKGVQYSADGCKSWQSVNKGLESLSINAIVMNPKNPAIVYAGTDGGAYISYDAGATWGQVNDGLLGAVVVYSIVVDKDGNAYAATPYGIFKLENK